MTWISGFFSGQYFILCDVNLLLTWLYFMFLVLIEFILATIHDFNRTRFQLRPVLYQFKRLIFSPLIFNFILNGTRIPMWLFYGYWNSLFFLKLIYFLVVFSAKDNSLKSCCFYEAHETILKIFCTLRKLYGNGYFRILLNLFIRRISCRTITQT